MFHWKSTHKKHSGCGLKDKICAKLGPMLCKYKLALSVGFLRILHGDYIFISNNKLCFKEIILQGKFQANIASNTTFEDKSSMYPWPILINPYQ